MERSKENDQEGDNQKEERKNMEVNVEADEMLTRRLTMYASCRIHLESASNPS